MIELIKTAAKHMLLDFEDSKRINHQGVKGTIREYSVFERFLRPYLPSRYSLGQGIVIDAEGKQSKQQDLVIYDDFFTPRLKINESENIIHRINISIN